MCFNFQVKFEDTPCSYPGMFESFVIVGSQKFGPCRSSAKKMARKHAAIVGLKELINWEPKEGMDSHTTFDEKSLLLHGF